MLSPDAKTKLYFLVGNPADHSLSPSIHNAAFAALKINSVYLACTVEEAKLYAAMEGMRALSAAGANVTSPYKEAVIPFLDSLSPEAQLLQSVNTIINRSGRLHGETTDGRGFYRSLQESAPEYDSGECIMVVGAGGAARAAAYTAARYGAVQFAIINRTPEKGRALAKLLSETASVAKSIYLPLSREDIKKALNECNVVIYSLPLDNTEFINAVSESEVFSEEKVLIDLRYLPARTAVMTAFEGKGGLAFNGMLMLLHQAAFSFEYFTGQKAPFQVMLRAATAEPASS